MLFIDVEESQDYVTSATLIFRVPLLILYLYVFFFHFFNMTLLGLPLVPSNKNYLVRDNGQTAPTGE